MVSLRLLLSSFPRPPWQRGNAESSATHLRAATAAAIAAAVGVGTGVGISLSMRMPNSSGHFMFNSPGKSSPLWASLSLTSDCEGTSVEPKTGMEFPLVLDGTRRLLGVGLRKRSIFGLKNIDVYAFGVYADEDDVKKLREKYQNLTISQLKESEEFHADVVGQDIAMAVRLQIVYSRLSIRSVRNAFEESVGNRLRKFSAGSDTEHLLKSFTSLFKDEYKIPRGSTIDLSREPGHVLRTRMDGNATWNGMTRRGVNLGLRFRETGWPRYPRRRLTERELWTVREMPRLPDVYVLGVTRVKGPGYRVSDIRQRQC